MADKIVCPNCGSTDGCSLHQSDTGTLTSISCPHCHITTVEMRMYVSNRAILTPRQFEMLTTLPTKMADALDAFNEDAYLSFDDQQDRPNVTI